MLLLFPKSLNLAFILYSVAASFPNMSLSKQRKVDKKCRVFNTIGPFPIFFTEVNGIPVFGVFTAGFSGEKT